MDPRRYRKVTSVDFVPLKISIFVGEYFFLQHNSATTWRHDCVIVINLIVINSKSMFSIS